MATSGEGKKIVSSFIENLEALFSLAEQRRIDQLSAIIQENRGFMPHSFLKAKMNQAQAVDAVLSDAGFKAV
jgi:hypothetical protein